MGVFTLVCVTTLDYNSSKMVGNRVIQTVIRVKGHFKVVQPTLNCEITAGQRFDDQQVK